MLHIYITIHCANKVTDFHKLRGKGKVIKIIIMIQSFTGCFPFEIFFKIMQFPLKLSFLLPFVKSSTALPKYEKFPGKINYVNYFYVKTFNT